MAKPTQFQANFDKLPKYCRACHYGDWTLKLWKKGEPLTVNYTPFRCRSWRHEGECQKWRGASDYMRILSAVRTRDDWSYLVFTMDQKDWSNATDQYIAAKDIWNRVARRLRKIFGPFAYIQTWERFKKGGCHVNVLLGNQNAREEFEERPILQDAEHTWLSHLADECGFGWRCYAEAIWSDVGLAKYLSKLAKEFISGSKENQTPYDAPPHFRRLRSSKHLLPPPLKNEEMTGEMYFKSMKVMASILGTGPKNIAEE